MIAWPDTLVAGIAILSFSVKSPIDLMRGSRVSSMMGAQFLAVIAFTSFAVPRVRAQNTANGGTPPDAIWMLFESSASLTLVPPEICI